MTFNRPGISDEFLMAAGVEFVTDPESHLRIPYYASQCQAVALWIVLSYLHDVVDILPLLLITSPEEECGKTTLAELIYNLSNRPIAASNISSAAVYRTIKDDCPTLILDQSTTLETPGPTLLICRGCRTFRSTASAPLRSIWVIERVEHANRR